MEQCEQCKKRVSNEKKKGFKVFFVNLILLSTFIILLVTVLVLHDKPYNNGSFAPRDRINLSDVHVYDDKVVIDVSNAYPAVFTDTNSMLPTFDKGHHTIEVKPSSPDDVGVGDIISFVTPLAKGVFIHRVIEKGMDEKGVFYVLRGDNLRRNDPSKVRFSDIRGVVTAIIY